MNSHLKIAARSSDLAKIQAYQTGLELLKRFPELNIEYQFRASWGDLNPDVPLAQSPSKGVFTEDFLAALKSGEMDLVVHSWKDLPTEPRPHTEVIATLPRAQMHDMLLLKRTAIGQEHIKLFSSSPRREYCLQRLLPQALPWNIKQIQFAPVRGNVQTRVRKTSTADVDGLIVARAALERLLRAPDLAAEFEHLGLPSPMTSADRAGFAATANFLRAALDKEFTWMVLPLSENPTAPAQGALALEIRKNRPELKSMLAAINDDAVFADVSAERERLSTYGGGCHLRLGISQKTGSWGSLRWEKGFINEQHLDDTRFEPHSGMPLIAWSECWPHVPVAFAREAIETNIETLKSFDLYVAKADAWPRAYKAASVAQVIWCSGWKSWQKLARLGVWVHGCSDGMGDEDPQIHFLIGRQPKFKKLTHDAVSGGDVIATYRAQITTDLNIKNEQCFFWAAPQIFTLAAQKYPQILAPDKIHCCGPGRTYQSIATKVPSQRLKVYPSYELWRSVMSRNS